MSPEDLLHMGRAARELRDFLMSKSSKPVWRASWTFSNIPEPPQYFCEPFYTALIFDKLCLVRCSYPPSFLLTYSVGLWDEKSNQS